MDNPKKVKIKFIKAYDFKTSMSTGVYGGITGNGLININFVTDRAVIPDFQEVEIDEGGRPSGLPKDFRDSDVVREVQFGTIMDITTAKVVAGWLNRKIEEYDTMFNK